MERGRKAVNAVQGVMVLTIIVILIAVATYVMVTDRFKIEDALANIETGVDSYRIREKDLIVTFYFNNVTTEIKGHFEAQCNYLHVENRTVSAPIPVGVDLVDVVLGDGDITREVVFDTLMIEDGNYAVTVSFITQSSTYQYKDIIIFEDG